MSKPANVQGRSRGKLYETTIRRKVTPYELELVMKKLRLHLESGVGSVLFMHFGRTRQVGAVHTESNVYAHKVHAKYANGTQVDLLEHIDSEVAGVQDEVDDLTETLDSATHLDAGTDKLVKRSAANTTTINNLVVKADEVNRSAALYPPPGLLFDNGVCETSLSCLNDAQVVFQPYDNGGNEIAGRSDTVGRAEDNDDEKDGLHFQDITDVNDTMRVRLNVGKTLPSVLLVGKKDSGVNMFEIRDHAGDTLSLIHI